MRNSSGCFEGLPVCKSAAMQNCSSPASSILRTANRTSRPADGFCELGFSWSDARLRRASSELEELGWLHRKASVTPAGDCAATEWLVPRIVIQTSETVRLEGVSYTGQSRPHKQTTQEGGSRAHARTRSVTFAEASGPTLFGAERISIERRLREIQIELAETCRKKERAHSEALFAEQCHHHDALGWTEPRRPKWLDVPAEILPPEDPEHEITDEERKAFCEQLRRLRESLQHSTQNERRP
jgi:hypothetical protein